MKLNLWFMTAKLSFKDDSSKLSFDFKRYLMGSGVAVHLYWLYWGIT